ncbi:unnamed protein product [Diatraea saccharalis]|uniref:EGF-like domain-containing protein n=1 Tax=Diatraea saccharalis TaxID=40085 RepID=A0A9N9R033_9NEOP|nr:unnamed protein product [Diatraea saccharalis]
MAMCSQKEKINVILIFFICNIIKIGGILRLDENKNVNQCQRCKILTDSFGHWLDKTSRGKFEGGDVAWEESKLKSYSRSEIRLVEIQEGLCSELKRYQDHCYSLAEETESVLEKWWFLNDPQSMDLYSWLCINTLQYCCPVHHFGAQCTSCPLDEKKLICSGHGKCDGDGTREGNGTCLCEKGYTGTHCDNCVKNFFKLNTSCEPCHIACNECSGHGINACKECSEGWQMNSKICVDVNECSDPSICRHNEYCVNKQGSYSCRLCDMSCKTCDGEGLLNCTSCESDSVLWSGKCVNDSLKSAILQNTFKRIALYSGLLIIAFFVLRHSRTVSMIIVAIIAVYVYFSEKTSDINMLNVLINLYLS